MIITKHLANGQMETVILPVLCNCHGGFTDWAKVCKLKLLNWLCINSFLYFSYAFAQMLLSASFDKITAVGSWTDVNGS